MKKLAALSLLRTSSSLASYNGLDPSGAYHAQIYVAFDVKAAALTVTEGTLLVVGPEDLVGVMDELTPSAAFAFGKFLAHQKERGFPE